MEIRYDRRGGDLALCEYKGCKTYILVPDCECESCFDIVMGCDTCDTYEYLCNTHRPHDKHPSKKRPRKEEEEEDTVKKLRLELEDASRAAEAVGVWQENCDHEGCTNQVYGANCDCYDGGTYFCEEHKNE